MALPSASEVPTTSPSHGSTSGGHMESYGAYRRKRYVLSHPRLHHPRCSDLRSTHFFAKLKCCELRLRSWMLVDLSQAANPQSRAGLPHDVIRLRL